MNGYSSAFTVKELNEDEFVKLENFAKTVPELITDFCTENGIVVDKDQRQITIVRQHFLGLQSANSFKLFSGEKMLLLKIASWIKRKIGGVGMDDFSSFSESECGANRSHTTKTVVGEMFTAMPIETEEKSSKQKKKIGKSSKKRKPNTANESSKSQTVHDDDTMLKFLIESLQIRLRKELETYVKSSASEKDFMSSCSVKVEELKLDVTFEEKDLEYLSKINSDNLVLRNEKGETIRTDNNLIKAMIKCYCSTKYPTPFHFNVYFRCNSKWTSLKLGNIRYKDPAKELSTTWIPTNFLRHLVSHQKF